MKTVRSIQVGFLLIVLRNDGGVYIGEPENGVMGWRNTIRVGSSAAICGALSDALREMAEFIRAHQAENGEKRG